MMRRVVLIAALALVGVGIPATAAAQSSHTILVRPGDSIQAAVDQAAPGDRVLVLPGTYSESGRPCPSDPADICAVVITKDDITLQGVPQGPERVVLRSQPDQAIGVAVARTGDPSCLSDESARIQGSTLSGFTVEGFDDDGVFLYCVDNWRITRVVANDNFEYGLFPSHVGAGRVDHSTATGANDTGIYVGQAHDVQIDHNVATGNVSGFEIENSVNVQLSHNLATHNTAGILSFTLPFLDVKANDHNRIEHNVVVANNKPNTCPPGDDVCFVPAGSGIALVGADHNLVAHNVVQGNNSFGILVANVCNALQIPPDACGALDVEPNSDGNQIVHDRALGNGANPDSGYPLPGADLVWDGTGEENCWAHDVFETSFPDPLPAC